LAWLIATGTAQADDIVVSGTWMPPNGEVGSDVILGMVVTDDTADADALMRVSYPVANFSEKRQIDIGKGGKSARAVHDIPIAAKSKTARDPTSRCCKPGKSWSRPESFNARFRFAELELSKFRWRCCKRLPDPGGQVERCCANSASPKLGHLDGRLAPTNSGQIAGEEIAPSDGALSS
jgi:hypothetical protein